MKNTKNYLLVLRPPSNEIKSKNKYKTKPKLKNLNLQNWFAIDNQVINTHSRPLNCAHQFNH